MNEDMKWYTAKIVEIRKINKKENVKSFFIERPANMKNFIVSSFVFFENQNKIIKPYTPIKVTKDHLIFTIKIYEKGAVTQYLDTLREGDNIKMSDVVLKKVFKDDQFKSICMIAGGTGITPMVQILEHLWENKERTKDIQLRILFGNIDVKNVFLEELLNKYTEKKNIIYFFDEIEKDLLQSNENYRSGYMTRDKIEEFLIRDGKKLFDQIYVCGPPGMMEMISGPKELDKSQGPVDGILKEIGYTEKEVYKF